MPSLAAAARVAVGTSVEAQLAVSPSRERKLLPSALVSRLSKRASSRFRFTRNSRSNLSRSSTGSSLSAGEDEKPFDLSQLKRRLISRLPRRDREPSPWSLEKVPSLKLSSSKQASPEVSPNRKNWRSRSKPQLKQKAEDDLVNKVMRSHLEAKATTSELPAGMTMLYGNQPSYDPSFEKKVRQQLNASRQPTTATSKRRPSYLAPIRPATSAAERYKPTPWSLRERPSHLLQRISSRGAASSRAKGVRFSASALIFGTRLRRRASAKQDTEAESTGTMRIKALSTSTVGTTLRNKGTRTVGTKVENRGTGRIQLEGNGIVSTKVKGNGTLGTSQASGDHQQTVDEGKSSCQSKVVKSEQPQRVIQGGVAFATRSRRQAQSSPIPELAPELMQKLENILLDKDDELKHENPYMRQR